MERAITPAVNSNLPGSKRSTAGSERCVASFFKIFIIFWVAQSLIFVISTWLIVRSHFDGPEAQFDTLDSSLQNDGNQASAAWEKGGCDALRAYGISIAQTISLADANGKPLCKPAGMAGLDNNVVVPNRILGSQVDQQFLWRVPVLSASGRHYVFLLSRLHVQRRPRLSQDLLRFSFPQLPVAIVVGGLTTFLIVFLFTRPVIRLRRAARELAMGALNAQRGAQGLQIAGAHFCRRRTRCPDSRLQPHGGAAGVAGRCAKTFVAGRISRVTIATCEAQCRA